MAELKYWLWLASRLRPAAAKAALDSLGEAPDIYFADKAALERLPGLTEKERSRLADKDLKAEKRLLSACEKAHVRILTLGDAEYPARLKSIYDPPTVLYLKGSLPQVDEEAAIAMVGTRNATAYGMAQTEKLAWTMTRQGGLVVSGLAKGIDTAAALGALRAGGRVIGVLGCAIDRVYPKENGRLFADVEASGCLVSEYGPGAPTRPENFPARNRIISGLSLGVFVAEAPERSGALITADYATEQGRDLFALPGNVGAAASAGPNALIRDGASPVLESWDLLAPYAERFPEKLFRKVGEKVDLAPLSPPPGEEMGADSAKKPVDKPEGRAYIDLKEQLEGLSADELAAVAVMSDKPMHVDDIIDLSGLPVNRALAALTLLQMKDFVRQSPGKRFSLLITKK